MRIISGSVRGKALLTPPGLHTRPTIARVKESVMSIIQMHIQDADVLDLFAGSGQMGLECLSRGAKSCVFCDNDKGAVDVLKKNISFCGFEKSSRVIPSDFENALRSLQSQQFDVILLDPPYNTPILTKALQKIAAFDILRTHGIIVCESARDFLPDIPQAPYAKLKEYKYGTVAVTTICREDA